MVPTPVLPSWTVTMMMMLFLTLTALTAVVHGGKVPCPDPLAPSRVTQADIDTILQSHNAARRGESQAANELKMTWNEELASRAQQWADMCTWAHNFTEMCDLKTKTGQNMYMTGGGATIPSSYDTASFVQSWTDEKAFYHFETQACDDICGHYTQVVWAASHEIGCGIAECPDVIVGSNPSGFKNALFFVCDYTPAGNYKGQSPYQTGTTCSACNTVVDGTSGWICEDDLCRPCTKETDDDCNCEVKTCQNGGEWNDNSCACECAVNFYGVECENECVCSNAAGYEMVCPGWVSFCTDPMYEAFMNSYCPSTCGWCDLPESCSV